MADLVEELAALSEAEEAARVRALSSAEDARRILAEDLPAFVVREVKKAFLASPAFADSLSDEVVAAIKAEGVRAGREGAEAAMAALAGQDPWLAGVEQLADNEAAATFEDNPAVWAAVESISAVVVNILERHGFPPPDGGFDVTYRQPAFFVGGRHMKSVAEHYWRALREMRELQLRREQLSASARAEELGRRWDSL